MVAVLAEQDIGAVAGAADVIAQVGQVDTGPDTAGKGLCRLGRQVAEADIERGRIIGRGVPQPHEARNEPMFEISFIGIEIDQQVERGGRVFPCMRRQAKAFDKDDIGGPEHAGKRRIDIIALVRIGRHRRRAMAQRGERGGKGDAVIAFGKALAQGQSCGIEFGIGAQEAVGGDRGDAQPGKVFGQRRRQRRFAGRDRAGDADQQRRAGPVVRADMLRQARRIGRGGQAHGVHGR